MLNHNYLICLATGDKIKDDGIVLSNPNAKMPALLRAEYTAKSLEVKEENEGMYRFSNWLPIDRMLEGSGYPITYKSERLAEHLGLSNLYMTFNGYWPEKGATMTTGTFKECEAYSVCARFPKDSKKILVVASAGNTARAFIKVCSENNIPLAVVVPEKNFKNIWATQDINSCVKIIAAGGDSDYFDAISLANKICTFDGFQNEGGAKNVARRDGMGTTVLSAVTEIGTIPDYYFQAVGSGTGAIAAYEANLRFIDSDKYGNKKMRLQVSQNEPFVPIYDAWREGRKTIGELDEEKSLKEIDIINAKVLANRKPPYGLIGGLYEALKDTKGDVLTATNEEAIEAQALFAKLEGVDICPESGIALASLIKKVRNNEIDKDSIIMVNLTGGGFKRIFDDFEVKNLEPTLVIPKNEINNETLENKIKNEFKEWL